MNEHIRLANEAMLRRDHDTALNKYYSALHDTTADETDRRIAKNKLIELAPDQVYGSTASWEALYHRETCQAKRSIWPNNRVTFKDWREAESAGYQPCGQCNPPRPGSVPV